MLSVITYIVLTIGGTCENIPVLTNLAKNSPGGRAARTMKRLEKIAISLVKESVVAAVKFFQGMVCVECVRRWPSGIDCQDASRASCRACSSVSSSSRTQLCMTTTLCAKFV